MRLALKRQRDKSHLRPHWYGHAQVGGRERVFTLCRWKGTPPASGYASDPGDAEFEKSRDQAMDMLRTMVNGTRSEADRQASLERLYTEKYGREEIEEVPITDMLERWKQFPRKRRPSAAHVKNVGAIIDRYIAHCQTYASQALTVDAVPADIIRKFFAVEEARGVTSRTYNRFVSTLRGIYHRLAPYSPAGRFLAGLVMKDENPRHREPFTAEELRRLIAVAKQSDPLLHALVVCAATTAMRRGDVARLKWESVNLSSGYIAVKTAKTGETTEIPVFSELQPILDAAKRGAGQSPYVWPEAAKLYEKRPVALDKRLREVMAAAGFVDPKRLRKQEAAEQPALGPEETLRKALKAIGAAEGWSEKKKKTARQIVVAYLEGRSMKELSVSPSTASLHLHAVEGLAGCALIRRPAELPPTEVNGFTVAEADPDRPRLRRASLRGWHSFRTTWITLALDAGVPMELVRKVTGHTAAEVVLKHYFRPGRESFRTALQSALPAGLIGEASPPVEAGRKMIDAEEACRIVETAKTLREARAALRAMRSTVD